MSGARMALSFKLNGQSVNAVIPPGKLLIDMLRDAGCYSVKFSDERGEGGADTVLLDGLPISASTHFALQAEGRSIETLEGLLADDDLRVLAETFLTEGAVQCGYCTPAMLVQMAALLREDKKPDELAIARKLDAVLCRCTAWVKPIQAALVATGQSSPRQQTTGSEHRVITRDTPRIDGLPLVSGAPVFAGDQEKPGLLHLKILRSPHAHARILDFDLTRAASLVGVVDIVTWQDVPRRVYTTAGQGFPEPSPYDTFILDRKVRHVGDRVAFVVAETPAIAAEACSLIKVDYETLPAFTDEKEAIGGPCLHDEERPSDPLADELFWPTDPARNLAARTELDIGDYDAALEAAEHVLRREYRSHQVQNLSLEPHVMTSWLDETGRLVIESSTQVPFHVRRVVSRLLDLPINRVRVFKPALGGGFGGKQEILGEEACALMTLRTGRPVRLQFSREEELIGARSRHPQRVAFEAGLDKSGKLQALSMDILENTGAYGAHALTVMSVSAQKGLSLYPAQHVRHRGKAVYSNRVPAGAYRGYGAPQAFWALESFMDEAARELDRDPLELRLANVLRVGENMQVLEKMGEGREGFPTRLHSGAIEAIVAQGKAAIGWDSVPRGCPPPASPAASPLRRGVGMALVMQGSGIPGIDMAAVSLKMNEDGSFHLLTGATDLGTGAETVLAQLAAEALGVGVADISVHAADTDTSPFDTGAYGSSTTYITGGAVLKAAAAIKEQILEYGASLLEIEKAAATSGDRCVLAPDGRSVSYDEIGTRSLYTHEQRQIMASASHMSYDSPPPFAAQFVEIEVDTETGVIRPLRFVTALDVGTVLNPPMAEGQVEGAVAQGLGMALCEGMHYDSDGVPKARSFRSHGMLLASELPRQEVIFVEDPEPTGPYGAKAVAEVCINGPAPALANALADACGVRLRETPLTPEKVLRAIRERLRE